MNPREQVSCSQERKENGKSYVEMSRRFFIWVAVVSAFTGIAVSPLIKRHTKILNGLVENQTNSNSDSESMNNALSFLKEFYGLEIYNGKYLFFDQMLPDGQTVEGRPLTDLEIQGGHYLINGRNC